MSGPGEQTKRRMNPRTYVLLGILVGALVLARSVEEQTSRARSRTQSPGVALRPPQAVAPESPPGATTPTQPGWGSDPFRKRFEPDEAAARAAEPARRHTGKP